MKTLLLENDLTYDGGQLATHWILKNTALRGDAIIAFLGSCHVSIDHMVDLEDVLADKHIYSKRMLHFLVEHFDTDLEKAILRQRLLMSLMQEELNDILKDQHVARRGDDLFVDHFKLTVSIATASPVSSLIHAGINILSEGTPVPTLGLDDFKINPHAFATSILNRYIAEMSGVAWARSKVRPV